MAIADAFLTNQGSGLGQNYGKNMATGAYAFFEQAGTFAITDCRSIALLEAVPAFSESAYVL